MVCGALVKELQLTRELDRMRGIVPDDILDALKKKLGLPGIDFEVQEDRNAMQMGEFEVIKELLAAYPAAKIAKAQVDKLVDLASPPPRGTGVENIRECIIESKMTFDVSAGCRELQGQHAQDHQEDLRAVLGHVRRPPPRPPQEQLHAQARLQDHDRDPPPHPCEYVEKKCGSLAGTPDFFDVIGQVSWYETS